MQHEVRRMRPSPVSCHERVGNRSFGEQRQLRIVGRNVRKQGVQIYKHVTLHPPRPDGRARFNEYGRTRHRIMRERHVA